MHCQSTDWQLHQAVCCQKEQQYRQHPSLERLVADTLVEYWNRQLRYMERFPDLPHEARVITLLVRGGDPIPAYFLQVLHDYQTRLSALAWL